MVRADALLHILTPGGERRLRAEIKKTNLTRTLVDGILARADAHGAGDWILFAPYVGAALGQYLRENGTNYMDAAGNCFIALDEDYLAHVEGKRLERRALPERGVRGPGHQVLFAILARRDLLNAPVRTLADAAGVGKTAAAQMLARLEQAGLVGRDREGRRLLQPAVILDRWLAGYTALVRPRLMLGRFRTDDADPEALENRIDRALGEDVVWAWGGGAAAMRLTGYYRGTETVLHLADPLLHLAKRLKAAPAPEGQLIVLKAPGRVAFEGAKPKTVHPLLIYTELLTIGHERARRAANEIRNRHLDWLAE
jgi:hypothetical protein